MDMLQCACQTRGSMTAAEVVEVTAHVPEVLHIEQLHFVALLGSALSTLNLMAPQWHLPFKLSFSPVSTGVSLDMLRL